MDASVGLLTVGYRRTDCSLQSSSSQDGWMDGWTDGRSEDRRVRPAQSSESSWQGLVLPDDRIGG